MGVIYFFIIFFLPIALNAETQQDQKQPIYIQNPQAPSTINVSINNTNNNNNWLNSQVNYLKEIMQDVRKYLHENAYMPCEQSLLSLKEFTCEYCKQHKTEIIGGSIALIYASLFIYLYRTHYQLTVSYRWSLWKSEYSIKQLSQFPHKELARELLIAIQQHYHSPTMLQDFFAPLISFFNDIEVELTFLHRFDACYKWINKLYLGILFPNYCDFYNKIPERIERLDYIKFLLTNWIAEYKIAVNTIEKQAGTPTI